MLDLDVYRTGGRAILDGANLYGIRAADNLPFTYPPVSAVLAIPLALLPFEVDKLGWVAMVYGPLLLAVKVAFRPILGRAGNGAMVALPVILAIAAYLQPINQEIGFGQVDLLLLGLCLIDFGAAAPIWPRGVLVGLATAIKLEPGVFIIYFLITKRRREAGIAAMSFLGLTALAWLISPKDSAIYWTSAIFDAKRLGGNGSAANQALRGMVLRLNLGANTDLVWLSLALGLAVCGFAAARACWKRKHDITGITITGLLGALLSPVAWIHHLCWVLVAIGILAGDRRRARGVALAAITAALFLTTLPTWAEHTLSTSRLQSFPGFVMENSFGLAALLLIPILFLEGFRADETFSEVGERAPPQPAGQLPATSQSQPRLSRAPTAPTAPNSPWTVGDA